VVGACRALLCVNKVCQRRGLLSRVFKWRYLPERGATRPAAVSDGERGGENRPPSPRRQPARRAAAVIRSVATRKGLFVYRLRIIRRYITVYHQTIQPARATEHTVWYFGFVPIRPPAAARVRSTPPIFYGTARARSRGVDRCGASPQQPHTHGML
jgi:hypothetical protein